MATNLLSKTHTHIAARRTLSVTSMPAPATVRRSADSREWRRDAKCQGDAATDFYPPFGGERKRDRVAREQRAKAICATCSVSSQCLQQAVATGERYGVWGGLTFEERLSFRRSA